MRLDLPFCFFLSSWGSSGAHVREAITLSASVGAGCREKWAHRGWEGNGLDLGCSLVLILATTECWTSRRYQIARLSLLLCTGLTPDIWKRFRLQESPNQVTPIAHPASRCLRKWGQGVSDCRSLAITKFTDKGRGGEGDNYPHERPAEPGQSPAPLASSLFCYLSGCPLKVRVVA